MTEYYDAQWVTLMTENYFDAQWVTLLTEYDDVHYVTLMTGDTSCNLISFDRKSCHSCHCK